VEFGSPGHRAGRLPAAEEQSLYVLMDHDHARSLGTVQPQQSTRRTPTSARRGKPVAANPAVVWVGGQIAVTLMKRFLTLVMMIQRVHLMRNAHSAFAALHLLQTRRMRSAVSPYVTKENLRAGVIATRTHECPQQFASFFFCR